MVTWDSEAINRMIHSINTRQPQRSPQISTVKTAKRDYTRPREEKTAARNLHALEMFGIVNGMDNYSMQPDEEFDYLSKAESMAHQAAKLRAQAVQQRAKNRNIGVANSPMSGGYTPNIPKGKFGAFIQAISGQESGGSYGAVNRDSGALGKYQIMPSNLSGSGRGWDYEALGRDVSSQQFLNNPRLQEQIARYKLRQYFNQYGPAGAASAWYSGSPDNWNSTASQGAYPSIHQYVLDILRRMGIRP